LLRFISILFCLFLVPVVYAQEFNYVHYDTKDGLSGSTVYDMCQDVDGFMWFATENGLTRFDGSHFKSFTVKDGLPDNEVLKIFPDSKGRIWIGTFAKEVCYYFKGKIYNQFNTPYLAQIKLESPALSFAEDEEGTLMISDFRYVYKKSKEDIIQLVFGSANKLGTSYKDINILTNWDHGGFLFHFNDSVFQYKNDSVKFYFKLPKHDTDKQLVSKLDKGLLTFISIPDASLGATLERHTTIFANTVNGAWSVDTLGNKLDVHFLQGKRVSRSMYDTEGNIWFATMGEGIYKLPSTEAQTLLFEKSGNTDNSEVFSLAYAVNKIIAGIGFSRAVYYEQNGLVKHVDFTSFTGNSTNNLSTNRLYCSKVLSSGDVVLGFDACLIKRGVNERIIGNSELVAIKSVDEIDNDHILVGTYSHAIKLKSKDLSITDTIWAGRCTKVLYANEKYYVGTINGLYEITHDKISKYLGSIHPSLTRRITGLTASTDGALWVATNDKGVLALKDGKIVAEIQDNQGLSSNICRSLYLYGDYLWVGTNKGLNRVDIKNMGYPIVKYSSSDGLPSDIVNALYVRDSVVWVGTPVGLTFFNEGKISHTSFCKLKILSVVVSGQEVPIDTLLKLSPQNNNIHFDFVAISFKSAGDIVYYYKLSGLDTGWQQTRETSLDYPSLPAGDYQLQLYAINKFGVKSNVMDYQFSIAAPFWRTWWFYSIVLLCAIVLTGVLVNNRNKIVRKRLEEKNNFQRQFAMLEQQALQAQMNPHFIFNCLNSIQQFILTDDKEKANEYLTGFAKLIRQTLDNSGKKAITVSEEVNYLSSYLEMEKMRFNENFGYSITVADDVMQDFITMPALLLQPFIENSLRHGIRYKQDGAGRVDINFFMEENVLVCQVKDNGIGRKKAAEFKSKQHIEYQSKGMSLTEKRIELLNRTHQQKITVEIVDVVDDLNNGEGTIVRVKIPL
jgi:hypothetical protein